MGARGVDDVLLPRQIQSLERRIELLLPKRDALATELALRQRPKLEAVDPPMEQSAMERALKQGRRIQAELTVLEGEIAMLKTLVSARVARL